MDLEDDDNSQYAFGLDDDDNISIERRRPRPIFDSIELLRSSLGNDQDSAEHDLLNVFFHNSPTKNSILFDFDDTSKVSSPMFGEWRNNEEEYYITKNIQDTQVQLK